MSRFGVLLALFAAAAAWPAAAGAASGRLSGLERAELRAYAGTLVMLDPARGRSAIPALRRAGGSPVASTLPIWRLPSRTALRILPGLLRTGLVRSVEPDRPVTADNHLSAGDPLIPNEWWIPVIGADRAEPPGPGKPVTVIDTGVDLTHPEYVARPATRAFNGQSTSGPAEEHGTAVASAAAAPANGVDLVGVYPEAALQIWDASPSGDGVTAGDVIAGIDTAIRNGPSVINISLGTTVKNPLFDAMATVAVGSGSVVVAAAGNDRTHGSPLEYPASLPHVLTVGAIDQSGQPAYFSSGSQFVDIAAPGVAIPVAVPTSYNPLGWDTFSGTSFAAPLAAGAAAWVWTARPTLDRTQLLDVLRASAVDIGSPGFDPFSGFGRLDIPAALAATPLPRDPQEPNDDLDHIKPKRLFKDATAPLVAPGRTHGTLAARLDFAEDPRDVYRVWIPGRRTAVVSVMPTGDVDLTLWGPRSSSVFEGGAARKRDLRGISERAGSRHERLRVRNPSKRGAYFYAEASVGAGPGTVVRRVGLPSYRISVSIVKPKPS